MSRRLISDRAGRFTLEVAVHGGVLDDAIEHHDAEEVLTCAVIAALSALAQDGPWPRAMLQSTRGFMAAMRDVLRREALM